MKPIYKVGLCAYGMSGKLFHAPFFDAHPGFQLKTIVRRSDQTSIPEYPGVKIVSDISSMLSDEDIDLVVINTPVQLHFEHAEAAILAGKNILVEKPFTVTSDEADELNVLALKHDVKLTVFQNRRYDRDFQAVKDIVAKNTLGKLHEVEMRFDRFRTSAGGKKHKEGSLSGSGTLYDLGAHLIDQSIQLFGIPEKLFADLMIIRPDVGSDDYFELLLYYPSNLRVRLISSVMVMEKAPGYSLHGDKGSFIQLRSDVQEETLVSGTKPRIDSWVPELNGPDGLLNLSKDKDKQEFYSEPGNYMEFFSDMYDYLSGNKLNPVPAEQAIQTISLIQKAFESFKQQKVITI